MEPSKTSRVEKPPGHNKKATPGIGPPSVDTYAQQALFAARHFFSLLCRIVIELIYIPVTDDLLPDFRPWDNNVLDLGYLILVGVQTCQ